MALKKCKECNKEVSTKARRCPQCGVINPTLDLKESAGGCLVVVVVIAILIVSLFLLGEDKPVEPLTLAEQRQENINRAFSGWDGSHIALTKIIKDSMNDPHSYKHIETRYVDQGDWLLVITEFTGSNAFGGQVKSVVKAYTDIKTGEVIQVISQE